MNYISGCIQLLSINGAFLNSPSLRLASLQRSVGAMVTAVMVGMWKKPIESKVEAGD
ncbi:hypothetical protein [Lysinibacillus sp. FSL K6-3209]|uniref:hypothetical protein n=1 Tax=Lysinibacillus sp. FSL K6-3209 TaxID=2921497 RepID=UPI0030DAE7D0